MFQPNPTTTDSGIVPHQKSAQECYLMDSIASRSLDDSNSIYKSTATKNSGNWYRWCTLLKHSVIADNLLGGIPQDQTTTFVSSFTASVRQNQFGTTRKKILLHGTVKYIILDVSASFRTNLLIYPTLESSGQTYLLLYIQLRG